MINTSTLQTISLISVPPFVFDNYVTVSYKTTKLTVVKNAASIQSTIVDSGNVVLTVVGTNPVYTISAPISFVSPITPPATSYLLLTYPTPTTTLTKGTTVTILW